MEASIGAGGFFDAWTAFDPAEEAEAFLKRIPAKGAVYLLADEEARPVQLLCVGNLRQSLKRRLIGEEQVGPSKRVNYRDLVRRIYWRRVDSPFEADWVYYEAARQIFPQTYRGMVGFRPAWFVHVDPDATFPRYAKTIDLSSKAGCYLGPFEDKHAAARWIQLVEDAFELCRYYNVLVEAPRGRPCAYKEMGRCPAPCDGSIEMPQYRQLVQWSMESAVEPEAIIAQQTQRMQAAAAALRFESAGKIKAYLDQVSQFGKGPFRFVRRLEAFRFVSVQRGPRAKTAKAFLIAGGTIREVAGAIGESAGVSDLARAILSAGAEPTPTIDEAGAERIGVVAHHLFAAKQSSGVFLRLDELDDKALAKGLRELSKQKVVEAVEEEGLVKELQGL